MRQLTPVLIAILLHITMARALTMPFDFYLEAEDYHTIQGGAGSIRGEDIRMMSGGHLLYSQCNFYEGNFDSIHIDLYNTLGENSNMYRGGSVEIRLDKLDGQLLGTVTDIKPTQAKSERTSFKLPLIKGIHDLYLLVKAPVSDVMVCGIDRIKLSGSMNISPNSGVTYYVDAVKGNDSNNGLSPDSAFKTISKASRKMTPGSKCLIREGIYRETIRPLYTGFAGAPLVYEAYGNEKVFVSAADPITNWEKHDGSIYKAKMDWNFGKWENQIFVNGKMVYAASCPNVDDQCKPPQANGVTCMISSQGDPTDGESISPLLIRTALNADCNDDCKGQGNKDPDVETYFVYLRHKYAPNYAPCIFDRPENFLKGALMRSFHSWHSDQAEVVASDPTSEMMSSQGAKITLYRHRRHVLPKAFQGDIFFSHLYEFLDHPNEYHFDQEEGVLYLWTPRGDSPDNYLVEAKKRRLVVDLESKSYIHINNIHFLGGSMVLENSKECIIDRCQFKYISHFDLLDSAQQIRTFAPGAPTSLVDDVTTGYKGIFVGGENNTIKNSLLAYSAGSGVILDGNNNQLLNNVMHTLDYIVSYNAGVYVYNTRKRGNPDGGAFGQGHLIAHNTMRGMGRSGFSWWGKSGSYRNNPVRFLYNKCSASGMRAGESGFIYASSPPMNVEIAYNWFFDMSQAAIWLDFGGRPARIHHNVFWHGNTIRMREKPRPLRGPISVWIHDGDRENGLNAVWNNTILTTYRGGNTGCFGENYLFGSAEELDLMDSTNLDFRPKATSPAVDAGKEEIWHSYWYTSPIGQPKEYGNGPLLEPTGCCSPHPGDTIKARLWTEPLFTGQTVSDYHGTAPDLGAYEYGGEFWTAGADWQESPWTYPPTGYGNSIINRASIVSAIRPRLLVTQKIIRLHSPKGTPYTLRLFDLSGKIIQCIKQPLGGNITVPLTPISSGILIAHYESGGLRRVFRSTIVR